jgi:MoxR-like ATPase
MRMQASVFPAIDDLRQKFEQAKYVVDEVTISQVYVAGELKKPVLIEGPPGCGKTELAKVLAFALDTTLERLQCYPGIDEERLSGSSIPPFRNSSWKHNLTSSARTGNPFGDASIRWISSFKVRSCADFSTRRNLASC